MDKIQLSNLGEMLSSIDKTLGNIYPMRWLLNKPEAKQQSVDIVHAIMKLKRTLTATRKEYNLNEIDQPQESLDRYAEKYNNLLTLWMDNLAKMHACYKDKSISMPWENREGKALKDEYEKDPSKFQFLCDAFWGVAMNDNSIKHPLDPKKFLKYIYCLLAETPRLGKRLSTKLPTVDISTLIDPVKLGVLYAWEEKLGESVTNWRRGKDVEQCAAFCNLLYTKKFFTPSRVRSAEQFALSQYQLNIKNSLDKLRRKAQAGTLEQKTEEIIRSVSGQKYGKI